MLRYHRNIPYTKVHDRINKYKLNLVARDVEYNIKTTVLHFTQNLITRISYIIGAQSLDGRY